MSTMSQHNKIAAVNFGPFSPAVESKLLFPIAHLDPAACVADAAAIARINPHRHEMALLDRMVWHSGDYAFGVGLKHVRSDEFWVRGHFPERPMYPGVLMIESAVGRATDRMNSS